MVIAKSLYHNKKLKVSEEEIGYPYRVRTGFLHRVHSKNVKKPKGKLLLIKLRKKGIIPHKGKIALKFKK